MFDFKDHIIKIMSNSPNRRLLRLQGKLQLTLKIYVHIGKSVFCFAIFQCTSHQQGWFRLERKSLEVFDIILFTKMLFFKFCVSGVGVGGRVAAVQLAPLGYVSACHNLFPSFFLVLHGSVHHNANLIENDQQDATGRTIYYSIVP
jgi:hypothetical protein